MVMAILKPSQAYSHIATQYDKIYSSHKCEIENEYIRTILKKHNIPDGQVLDLGCGWGVLSSYLAMQGANVVGVDIDKKVKPYFEFISQLNDVYPKFINDDIFSKDFNIDYDYFIACDVCFYKKHTKDWAKFIKRITSENKQLLMSDPGRDPFWELLKICDVPHIVERYHVKEPRKADSYLVIFGE